MTDGSSPIERVLERMARGVSGGGLHPAELLSRVQAAYLAGASQGIGPNRVTVRLHPDDYALLSPAFAALRTEVAELLLDEARRAGLHHIGDLVVGFERDPAAARSIPAVETAFADTSHPRPAPAPGATVVMQRHRRATLLVDDQPVPLTHTPFTIGRGPGNDLVLPSLAVSRTHARIVVDGPRFILEDLGGKNGVQVDGVALPSVVLAPGLRVFLGDVMLELVGEG